jgi:long-chain acyl-CoA synthetase
MSKLQDKLHELRQCDSSFASCLTTSSSMSYDELLDRALRAAEILDCEKQAIVSVVLPNSIEYLVTLLACLLSGKVFNPIPYFTSNEELARILAYVEPSIIITDKVDVFFSNDSVTVITPAELNQKTPLSFQTLIDNSPENALAALYYSSGTTGSPKGVLYSHENVFELIKSIVSDFGHTSKTKHFACLPFGHTAAINYNILPAFFTKSNLLIAESFMKIAPQFFRILAMEKVNYVQVVPTIILMLLKLKADIRNLDLSNLLYIGVGSSILPLESQIAFQEQFGIRLANLYGLSETGPSHFDDPTSKNWKPGSIGVPLSVNKCRLAKDSEIMLKGKNVFCGYYKNESLYQEVLKDGWFHTGDFGRYENGMFFYLDRKKDLIIKGGINILPAEIEELIYRENRVLEAVVAGVPDSLQGEDIGCAITLRDNTDSPEDVIQSIRAILSQTLSRYKHPTQFIVLGMMPKTLSGKLKRGDVRKILAQ